MAHTVEDIRPVLDKARSDLMKKANVVATGIGYKVTNGRKTGDLAIICSVESKKSSGNLHPDDVTDEILEIGAINSITEGVLGMDIQKSGRTTGLTTGMVEQIDVTVRVNFGVNRIAVFEDQLIAGAMSQGGDSGSVVLDMEKNLIGLLFAGSNTTTVINRIQNVFSELEVTLP